MRPSVKKEMMNHSVSRAFTALLVSAAMPAVFGQATLKVDLNRPKAPVSPTLYGLMTEEINYSYDGGLYAELVRNRIFRDPPDTRYRGRRRGPGGQPDPAA